MHLIQATFGTIVRIFILYRNARHFLQINEVMKNYQWVKLIRTLEAKQVHTVI